jgi:hypothetical protein
LSAEERLYQRLLAGDADEAWDIVGKELESKSRIEVSDSVLIPALALAERERHFGALDAGMFATVAERMTVLVDEVEDHQRAEKDKTPDQLKPTVDEMPHTPDEEARPVPILCIAAEDEADGVVATMADRALRRMGYVPTLISSSALTGELPLKVEELKAPVVLISNLPPSGFAQVRYICKRLAGKFEQIHVIIGIWGANLDATKARERLPKQGNFYFVTSLAEAMRQAHELYRTFSLQPELKGDDTTVTAPPARRGSASKPG